MKNMNAANFDVELKLTKFDACGLVYGWASVIEKDGAVVVDRQQDVIEFEELEKAVHDFVTTYRQAGEMHQGQPVGELVESFLVTREKLLKMGFSQSETKKMPTGWWIGIKLDPVSEAFKKVQSGTYTSFSIEGQAIRESV